MKKVLIVDDMEQNRYFLEALLRGYGYETETATNGSEALEKARANTPDIIIADILMPVMDGFVLCKAWKNDNQLKRVPFIIYTATYTDPKDEAFALSIGADRFLIKPLESRILIEEIEKFLLRDSEEPPDTAIDSIPENAFIRQHYETVINKLEHKMVELGQLNVHLEREIAERKAAQADLEKGKMILAEAEEKYRKIFENAIMGIWQATEEGQFISVNPAFAKMFGYSSPEEMIAQVTDIAGQLCVNVDDGMRMKAALLDKRNIAGFEIEVFRKDGTTMWTSIDAYKVYDIGGKLLYFEGTGMDITERKQVERALMESELQYRNLADSGLALIWKSDRDKFCTYFNAPWLKFTGRTIEQELGNGWIEGVYPEDLDRCLETYVTAFDEREVFDMEYRLRNADGEYRWIRDLGTPNYNSSGEFIGYIGHCFDITAQKKVEKEINQLNEKLEARVRERTVQLESVNKRLESFSYSVSHDLRAPLRAVDGYARILLEEYKDSLDTEGKQICESIVRGAQKMGKLIDDLLAFSRLERASMQRSFVNMADLANSAVKELTAIEDRERIDIVVDSLAPAIGDASLLKQVWLNLLSNAIKFSSKKERAYIKVSCQDNEDELVYSVRDNGAGFNMKYDHRLFGVFQRLHNENEFPGTGVGLAIVKLIITRHGGRVWATSEVDKGATFSFALRKDGYN